MTIRVDGVPLSISGTGWANLWHDYMTAGTEMVVLTGLAVSQAGTRTVSVSSGRSVQAGTRAVVDASVTLAQLPAAVTNPRIDRIVLQIQWPASDSTDTSLTAGTIVAVPGSEGSSPVPPGLTQTPGVTWQTPLAQVKVNTNGTIVITDERPFGSSSQAITWPGNFTQGSPPFTVRRSGSRAFLDGQFVPGVDIAVGTSAINTVIIPAGYRPVANSWVLCHTDAQSSGGPRFHNLLIQTDGTGVLYPGTGTIPSGHSIRIVNSSWLIGA